MLTLTRDDTFDANDNCIVCAYEESFVCMPLDTTEQRTAYKAMDRGYASAVFETLSDNPGAIEHPLAIADAAYALANYSGGSRDTVASIIAGLSYDPWIDVERAALILYSVALYGQSASWDTHTIEFEMEFGCAIGLKAKPEWIQPIHDRLVLLHQTEH